MNQYIDFADTPPRRRRRREQHFYRWLAACSVAAALPVLAWGWQLQGHASNLHAAGALVEQALHAQQTALDTATRITQDIATLEQQLQAHATLAAQRSAAPALLGALARAAAPGAGSVQAVRLVHLGLRHQQAQLRGHANDQQALQTYIDRLAATGVAEVRLQELRAANASAPQRGFVFMLSLRASP